jgi:hypothetical protein
LIPNGFNHMNIFNTLSRKCTHLSRLRHPKALSC